MAPEDPNRPADGASGARVDYVVDEKGSRIDVPDDSRVASTGNAERAIGNTGPSNWWRIGLLILALIVVAIGLMQILGGAPSTEVQPGSPTSEPVTEQVAPQGQ